MSRAAPNRVVKVLLAECRLPLPRAIRLGPVEITSRDYIAMRLIADDGTHGDAIGYPRGTPLQQIASGLAREIMGTSPDDRKATLERILSRRVNARSTFIRAASLFDIALSDLASKAAGDCWGNLHGGVRSSVPLMAVAGYFLDERSVEDVVREVANLLDEGYARVKIMLRGDDLAFDRHYVEACMKVAGDRLAADAHWSFRSLDAAREYLAPLDDLGLAFLEDPFGVHLSGRLPALQLTLRTPLAAGEDMPDEYSLADLANAIPILRIDATTCGGLSSAWQVVKAVSESDCRILPHVFAPIHAQLAAASTDIEMVEIIPEAVGADPVGQLLQRPQRVNSGQLKLDSEPGAGIALDWARVTEVASDTTTIEH